MASISPSWARVAYIRTTHCSTDPVELDEQYWTFLNWNVRQWKYRHRYILGAETAADAIALDLAIARTTPGSRYYDQRLHPSDFLVYLTAAAGEGNDNEESASRGTRGGRGAAAAVRQKLQTAGIAHVEVAAESPDEAMLRDSSYVLDPLTWRLGEFAAHEARWDAYRAGRRPREEGRKFDVSRVRLERRQAHHSYSDSTNWRRTRGVSEYRCVRCGGACKRSRPCQVSGTSLPARRIYVGRKEVGMEVDDVRFLPPKGDASWLELTAEDLIVRYRYERDRSRWHSIDTFSGTVD